MHARQLPGRTPRWCDSPVTSDKMSVTSRHSTLGATAHLGMNRSVPSRKLRMDATGRANACYASSRAHVRNSVARRTTRTAGRKVRRDNRDALPQDKAGIGWTSRRSRSHEFQRLTPTRAVVTTWAISPAQVLIAKIGYAMMHVRRSADHACGRRRAHCHRERNVRHCDCAAPGAGPARPATRISRAEPIPDDRQSVDAQPMSQTA